MTVVPPAWDTSVLAAFLAIVYPLVALYRQRRLAARPDPIPRRAKLRVYVSIVLSQWLLVAVLLVVLGAHGLTAADVGERVSAARRVVWFAIALAIPVAVLAALNLWQIRRASAEQLAKAVRGTRKLLPRDGRETAVFAVVSVTAGVCEELLYRGYMIAFLTGVAGSVWTAVGISAVVFGLGHAYQGSKGVLTTAAAGLILGTAYVLAGSLVPVQIAHAAVNVTNGLVARRILARLEPRQEDPPPLPPMP